MNRAFPNWKNHRYLKQKCQEMSPFFVRGKRYCVEDVMFSCLTGNDVKYNFHEDHFRIRDLETGHPVSHPLLNHYFATVFIHGDKAYAFSADYGYDRPWWTCQAIDVIVSDDLISWSKPVPAIRAENENLFNNAVTRASDHFYMLYETDDRAYPAFTFKFAWSDDLLHWNKIPDALYGTDKYVGGPSMYYIAPFFYVTYVNHNKDKNGRDFFDSRIVRSKDLITWEEPKGIRPVVYPDFTHVIDPENHPDQFEINASDVEFEEKDGKVIAYWNGGNQWDLGDAQSAEYDGSLKQLFESFFEL